MKYFVQWACSALCAISFSVQATTLVYKSFDDIVSESDGIVVGTVVNIKASLDSEGEIFTYVTLEDIDVLNGEVSGNALTLRLQGGEVDNEGVLILGSPSFTKNERVVVFVEGNGQRIVPIVGWNQGLFKLKTDKTTGNKIVTDGLGNQIFGIQNSHVVKESRFSSEANIIGKPELKNEQKSGMGSGGESDNGITNKKATKVLTKRIGTMTEGQFIAEIRSRLTVRKKHSRLIRSVTSSLASANRKFDGVTKKGSKALFNAEQSFVNPVLPRGGKPKATEDH